jgi:hypothetical protein
MTEMTMTDQITDVAALEACVGKVPGPLDLKVMDHLDDSALRWLALSPLLFATFADAGSIGITLGAGVRGFVRADDPRRLRLPAASLDDPLLARTGASFGSLMMVPGIGETLRVNGRVAAVEGGEIEIAVEECYLHCAKALIRSGFWAAAPQAEAPAQAGDFLAATRFMALASVDREGRADLSPKGDPAGAMLRLHADSAWYADRPGNRRVDSFRNILTQPRIAALALIPGAGRVALLSGRARITTDASMRAAFAVGERTPKIVTRVEDLRLDLRDSAALRRARPWPAPAAPEGIDPAAMFVAHVKQSKVNGLQAKLARAALSVPGLMEKGLQHDYKKNLY